MTKKPPDIPIQKYQTIKIPLHYILPDKEKQIVIEDAVQRANKCVIKMYQLGRLWILHQYHSNLNHDIPKVTKETFNIAYRVVNQHSNKCDKEIFKQMKQLFGFSQEDGSQLTVLMNQYISTEMVTAVENNIKLNYFKHLGRFINAYWKNEYREELDNKTLTKTTLRKELRKVKQDILNGTETSDPKYRKWIEENREKMIPITFKTSRQYDLKEDPQRYLKHMIWMNLELEKLDAKMFQCFPLRTNIIPKFIHLDTQTIIKLLIPPSDKTAYMKNTTKLRDVVWTKVFNTKYIHHIESKMKNYLFDYGFMTDGYNVSLRFIHVDVLTKKVETQDKMRKGREANKGLTKEERAKKRQEKLKKKKSMKHQEKLKTSKKKSNSKSSAKQKKKSTNNDEFLYMDEIPIEILKEKKFVVVDPGKRDLLTMLDQEGNRFRYSNKQRVKMTKRLKYQRLLHNHREKLGILEIEEELNGINCKTCDLEQFEKYLRIKNEVNAELFDKYQDVKFRQYRWYAYINKRRAEEQMLNQIEKIFGKDINILYGDWSQGQQMKHFISTPNLGIKRKLAERFPVFNLDEFRTSKLHHLTGEKCNNLYLEDQSGKLRKKHAILTCQMKNKRLGCINRDYNGCLNMIQIVEHYLETGKRPSRFCRGSKAIKVSNPSAERRQMDACPPGCKGANKNNIIRLNIIV